MRGNRRRTLKVKTGTGGRMIARAIGKDGRSEKGREPEGSRVDGGLLGKSNILQLAISCPSRAACKIPLRANRTRPLSPRRPPPPPSGAASDNESGRSSAGLVVTTSNGRSALQYAKYARLHPVAETRSLPDVGFRNERAFAPKPVPPPHRWR